jgi:hypothetical protein
MEDRGSELAHELESFNPLIPYSLFSILHPLSSMLYFRYSILDLLSSILDPQSSIFYPPSSKGTLRPDLCG